jgi:hypothetical protein
MISMNQVWDDAVSFIRRESALLVPVALATLYVGDVVSSLAGGATLPTERDALARVAIFAATLWSIVGQLSIISLVLKPGLSVGEALAHGGGRLGKVLLVALLIGAAVAVLLMPAAIAAVANGANPAIPATLQMLPGWVSVLILATAGLILWMAVRLALMNALIVDQNPGVVESIRRGFMLTKGIASRLLLVGLLYVVVLVILGKAVQFVAGSAFALLGAALGSVFVGQVLTALFTGLISTALSLVATVFLAMLYRGVIKGT